MTGALTLNGDPTGDLQAATKRYVDSKSTNRVLLGSIVGGTASSMPIDFQAVYPTVKAITVECLGTISSGYSKVLINNVEWVIVKAGLSKITVTRPVLLKDGLSDSVYAPYMWIAAIENGALGVAYFDVTTPINLTISGLPDGVTLNMYAEF